MDVLKLNFKTNDNAYDLAYFNLFNQKNYIK
ncbi:hypothetical protein KORDIASMS9_04230 [Kordia sp. SMS9]|nr:hypothetical protein KORDIASMS9_04230 [Kordia sp. SMS9]